VDSGTRRNDEGVDNQTPDKLMVNQPKGKNIMDRQAITAAIESLAALEPERLFQRDFLLSWDLTLAELQAVFSAATILQQLRRSGISSRVFDSGLAVSIFRDHSTRTRFSFASAANLMGLTVQDMDEGKSQIAHGETVRETACMISFLTETIGIRDDIYLGAGHTYMQAVAQAVEEGFAEGVLPQRPSLINLQCDIDHPTQTLSDALHLIDHFGGIDRLRGKRLAMTWAYSPSYGKPLSVPQGVIGLMTRLGMDVRLAHPPGYQLMDEVTQRAADNARGSGGRFAVVDSMAEAFDGADIVYPKSWAPYQVMEQRTQLLKSGDTAGLQELEKSCLDTNRRYRDWECNQALMQKTGDGRALYLHCLPADISGVSCEQGEVSAPVFERYRTATYRQAGYKPFVIAAMILLSRFRDPAARLQSLLDRNQPRC
jgi:knotted carbamoyltransferase YgeW